jgi:hypothetical protein
MAADKYLYNNAGQLTEKSANQSSAGAGDAGKIPALDSSGRLDSSMMPVGVEIETETITASEALSAGDFVNIWNSTGLKVRKADATAAGKEANGFVLASVSNGAAATVYRKGFNTSVSGLTVGTKYFLHTTAGGLTSTAPSASGNVVQPMGVADAATSIYFVERNTLVLV